MVTRGSQEMIIHLPLFESKAVTFKAITLFCFVIIWTKTYSDKLKLHELEHVKQWKEDPILFYPKYVLEFIVNLTACGNWMEAYRGISYEVAARKASE
jgi:hypothetical protein